MHCNRGARPCVSHVTGVAVTLLEENPMRHRTRIVALDRALALRRALLWLLLAGGVALAIAAFQAVQTIALAA